NIDTAPIDKAQYEVLDKARHAQLEKARQIFQGFVDKNAGNPETRLELAWAYARVGKIDASLGQNAEAVEAHHQAIALYEQLAADFPNDPLYRLALADQYEFLGKEYASVAVFCTRPGRRRVEAYRQAVAVCTRLAQDFPGNREYRLRLVKACDAGIAL